jgi:hypothetical protein
MTDALPHDDAVERALLGSVLLEPHRALDVASLPVTAFYSERHRVIFRGIAQTIAMHGTTDLVLLFRHLSDTSQVKAAGNASYLAQLHSGAWTAANIKHYAGVLRDLEARRDAIVGAEAAGRMAQTEGVEAVRAAFATLTRRLDLESVHPFSCLDLAAAARGEIPEIPWIVEGWLGRGDATLFGGEWGTGKSLIALDLALAVVSGEPWLGRINVARAGPVLYLDEENNPVNATRRLSRMIAGRDLDQDTAARLPLVYGTKNRIKLDVAAGYATVERLIVEREIRVLILDSFIRFGRLNANKNDELAKFFDECISPLIGRYGLAVVMLDHMRKPNADDDKTDIAHRITGGADKSGFADNVWVIHGKRDETSRTFEARKNRWEDTLPPPMTTKWEVSEDEVSARITAKDAALDAETAILATLLDAGGQGIYATDLFEAAERRSIPKRTAIRTIKRMVRRGAATKLPLPGKRVKYYLADVAPNPT